MAKAYKYNVAQSLLIAIGGTAAIVGGWEGNGWPDQQTPKRHRRAGAGKGTYGRILQAHFDSVRNLGPLAGV